MKPVLSLAMGAAAGFIAVAGYAFGSTLLRDLPTLDGAQAALEADADLRRSRGHNWPVFKQANSLAKLNCRDTADASLRLCTITVPSIDPLTGQSSGTAIVDDFACSVSTCEWLAR